MRFVIVPWALLACFAAIAIGVAGCATDGPPPLPDTTELTPDAKIDALRDAVAEQPQRAEAHYELGNALFDLGRVSEAREHYARAAELNPEHAAAFCNLGLCLRFLGDFDGAIAAYERALELDPDDLTTLQNVAVALSAAGEVDAVIPYLMRIADLKPNDVQAHSDLGKALLQSGRYIGAAEAYQRVLELDPGYAGDYYNLGLCYYYLEDWDATVAAWLTALAHNSDHPSVHKGLAVAYWQRGEYDKAWESVIECQRLGVPLAADFMGALQRDSGRVGPSSSVQP